MRTMEVKLFKFDELDDKAKEKARDWWRQGALQDNWWDAVYEDAAEIAKIIGIDLRTKPVKLMNGNTRYDPCIWFSGFSSQGDGACFEGTYRYAKGSRKAIRAYCNDAELYAIVDGLYEIQRKNRFGLTASVSHHGNYYFARSASIDVDSPVDRDDSDDVRQLLCDFMHWIYKQLEAQHDYLMSDEAVDESIECNEYEFTEDGHIS